MVKHWPRIQTVLGESVYRSDETDKVHLDQGYHGQGGGRFILRAG